MAITKKTEKKQTANITEAAEAFICAAPDAKTSPRTRKGKKVQISLTMTEALLDRVDQLAEDLGQSRAGIINLAVIQMLDKGLRIDGTD